MNIEELGISMRLLARHTPLLLAATLTACVPDTTGQADFYELCTAHVENYLTPGDRVLSFESAQKRGDYVFRKSEKKALITTFVREIKSKNSDQAFADEQIRKCSFIAANQGWKVE